MVLVEHDPLLLAACDHIVEFGPGGGPAGGHVVASDHPTVVRAADTPTGKALSMQAAPPPLPSSTATPGRAAATRAEALCARAEIRQILGDDVEVPEDGSADEPIVPAALAVGPPEARRPLELAGLDHEIAKALLDAAVPDTEAGLRVLAAAWEQSEGLRLQVHPMLDTMVTWGARVPRSIVAEARTHLAAMGLRLVDEQEPDIRALRATGPRFRPAMPSPEARLAAVRDAFALGGGYVELAEANGEMRAKFSARLMDLEKGLVGPRQPTPRHLRRSDALGRCPMCRGAGSVVALDSALLIRDQRATVADAAFLDPRAAAILKGVVRAEFVPFFRRLADEGLWDEAVRWNKLDGEQRTVVLHGHWTRPGPGTFIKKGRDIDGSEVNHWLRWDGLVAAVESQLARSTDAAWREAVASSRKSLPCPSCYGTGFGSVSELVLIEGRSLRTWQRDEHLGVFLDALQRTPMPLSRSCLTRARIAACLDVALPTDLTLRDDVSAAEALRVEKRVVRTFVSLSLIIE